ncbi:MAG: ferrous iron transport protein A [Eubacterium sp.]
MFLSDMKAGQTGVISSLPDNDNFSVRLMDLGFCPGEKVECLNIALMKSPVLYRVKGTNIALRKCDARKVGVIL